MHCDAPTPVLCLLVPCIEPRCRPTSPSQQLPQTCDLSRELPRQRRTERPHVRRSADKGSWWALPTRNTHYTHTDISRMQELHQIGPQQQVHMHCRRAATANPGDAWILGYFSDTLNLLSTDTGYFGYAVHGYRILQKSCIRARIRILSADTLPSAPAMSPHRGTRGWKTSLFSHPRSGNVQFTRGFGVLGGVGPNI